MSALREMAARCAGIAMVFALANDGCATSAPSPTIAKPPAAPAWAQCRASSECVVWYAAVCPPCARVPRSDLRAVNAERLGEYASSIGADTSSACPACVSIADFNVVATCERGACQLVDIRERDLVACGSDADCTVRSKRCGEGFAWSNPRWTPVARNRVDDFTRLVCAPTPCPQCDGMAASATVAARCVEGRCVL